MTPQPQRDSVFLQRDLFQVAKVEPPKAACLQNWPVSTVGCGLGLASVEAEIRYKSCSVLAPLLSLWPLVGPDVRAWAVPTAPLVFLACRPPGQALHSALGWE